MATSKVVFSYVAGETLTLGAMSPTGDAYLYSTTAVSESPSNSGLYTGTFTESSALSGALRIVVLRSSVGVASYQVRFTGSDGERIAASEFTDLTQVATAANLATVDTVVDSILVDTGTTIPAQITALNDFDPASDAVANVTLVATTTTNTDMRGTDGANTTTPNTVAPDNASVAAILVDTGTTIPAQITALNNFDPASDTVANVTTVGTTTTNSDMRGTDSAATAANLATVDANVDSILVDTGTTIPAQVAALNNFDPASDAVANVTLVATTTTNTDMRGTDSAATAANLATVDTVVDAIKVKSDQLVFSTANRVDASVSGGGGDATAANQASILAKLAASSVVYTNPSSPNKLTIVRGDAYDDSAKNNGKLTWATGKTLTGASVRFTIRDASDNILIDQTTTGVSTAVSSQNAEVSLTTAATALLTVATTHKFDAEAYWTATNRWTFARGNVTVLEDQTRS
ncbi:MAG: hypothetical protein CL524_05850 [Aequorivita sp.]|nr:hypothetical protein [Aequorivita sp.]